MSVKVSFEKVYQIDVATDERRGGPYCYSDTEAVGLEIARGKGWYGGNGYVSAGSPLEVVNIDLGNRTLSFRMKDAITVYHERDYKQKLEDQARARALAKLTDADKRLLGLI